MILSQAALHVPGHVDILSPRKVQHRIKLIHGMMHL